MLIEARLVSLCTAILVVTAWQLAGHAESIIQGQSSKLRAAGYRIVSMCLGVSMCTAHPENLWYVCRGNLQIAIRIRTKRTGAGATHSTCVPGHCCFAC